MWATHSCINKSRTLVIKMLEVFHNKLVLLLLLYIIVLVPIDLQRLMQQQSLPLRPTGRSALRTTSDRARP